VTIGLIDHPPEDGIMEFQLLDRTGRRRSPATLTSFHQGQTPRNKGLRCPSDSPAVSHESRPGGRPLRWPPWWQAVYQFRGRHRKQQAPDLAIYRPRLGSCRAGLAVPGVGVAAGELIFELELAPAVVEPGPGIRRGGGARR